MKIFARASSPGAGQIYINVQHYRMYKTNMMLKHVVGGALGAEIGLNFIYK